MMKKRIAKILMCFGITVVLTACGSNGVALTESRKEAVPAFHLRLGNWEKVIENDRIR